MASLTDLKSTTGMTQAISGLALGSGTNVTSPSTTTDIGQSERLFLARPRSADANQLGPEGRGQYAYIKLLTNEALKSAYASGDISKREISDSNSKELFSWASNMVGGSGYDKFLLTGVSGTLSEKVQVKEVFGDGEVAYFFGRQPIYLNLSGILIDSPDNQWFTDWLRMYSEFFRGTQLAKNYELLKIVLPNMTVVGAMLGMSWNQDAGSDVDVGFTFQFLVKSLTPAPITNPDMIRSPSVKQINFKSVNKFLTQSGINSLKGQVTTDSLTKIIQNPASTAAQKQSAMEQLGGGVQGILGSISSTVKGGITTITSNPLFQGVNSALTGIRSSLFSPVYGVLTTLTKLLTTVSSGGTKIFSAFSTPVLNILRDITSIANQANAIMGQVNRSTSGLGRYVNSQLYRVTTDYKNSINTIGRATGAIASKPTTALQSAAVLHSSGFIPSSAPFLRSDSRGSFSRPVLGLGIARPSRAAILTASTLTINTSASSLDV